jgi:ABC-type phosphate/phosphonate transport system ATPase subunit
MNGYRRRCGTVVQGFLMLPKEYILNNRLLKYFKKHSVFERLANI